MTRQPCSSLEGTPPSAFRESSPHRRSVSVCPVEYVPARLVLAGPGQEMTTGQFRPIITANRERRSALRNNLIQHAHHSAAAESRW